MSMFNDSSAASVADQHRTTAPPVRRRARRRGLPSAASRHQTEAPQAGPRAAAAAHSAPSETAAATRLEDVWNIPLAGNRSPWYLAVKRTIDLAGAAALLLLLSPLLLTTLAILLVTTRGRPIFCQERVGLQGRPFRLYKFRTMVLKAVQVQGQVANEQAGPVFKNRTDPRITRLGRILRRTSVDELPQLVNVLLGQMSLVGPRPPLASEVVQYEPWQRMRLSIKPGLTCLWQVSGRSEIGFGQWMLMDVWYVENQGLLTDLALLVRTPWAVLSRRGAY